MFDSLSSLTFDLQSLLQVAGYLAMFIGFAALGAVSVSNTFQGTDFFRTDVIATLAVTDTVATIPHGLGAIKAAAGAGVAGLAPLDVTITPLIAAGAVGNWVLTTVNTTNVVITKTVTTGTASAARQVRVVVSRPHSIGR